MGNKIEPRILSLDDAADYCGISKTTFLNTAGRDVLPLQISERRRGWDRKALDAWIDRLSGAAAEAETTARKNPLEYLTE